MEDWRSDSDSDDGCEYWCMTATCSPASKYAAARAQAQLFKRVLTTAGYDVAVYLEANSTINAMIVTHDLGCVDFEVANLISTALKDGGFRGHVDSFYECDGVEFGIRLDGFNQSAMYKEV